MMKDYIGGIPRRDEAGAEWIDVEIVRRRAGAKSWVFYFGDTKR